MKEREREREETERKKEGRKKERRKRTGHFNTERHQGYVCTWKPIGDKQTPPTAHQGERPLRSWISCHIQLETLDSKHM
jgi:hypothetical protein